MTQPRRPRRVVVLTADAFEDLEVFYPMFRLQEAGAIVDIAAPTMDPERSPTPAS